MNQQSLTDAKSLIREICRYLAAVDAFRAAGCEPTWLPELVPGSSASAPHARPSGQVRSDVGLH